MKTLLMAGSILTSALLFASSVSAQDWSGPYISGGIGSSKIAKDSETLTFDTNLDGQYGDTVHTFAGDNAFSPGFCNGSAIGTTPMTGCKKESSQAKFSIKAGYDWQMDHFVYGVFGEIGSAGFTDSVSGFSNAPDSYTFARKIKSVQTLGARAGYAENDWLFYATAGLTWANIDQTFSSTNSLNSFSALNGKSGSGFVTGLGVERKIADKWSIGLEYLHSSIGDKSATVHAGPSNNTFASNPFLIANSMGTDIRRSSSRFKNDSLVLRLTYRFGAMAF